MYTRNGQQRADCIVIGVGSMGAATCYYLAKRGARVIGLEQFGIVHDNGSHGGQSRIIRKAYFEHPDYIPLLQLAYDNWHKIEKESGRQIYSRTGLLYSGPFNDPLIEAVKSAALLYQIPLEKLSLTEAHKRFPAFCFPTGSEVLFEPDAGYLRPDAAIETFTQRAKQLGAHIETDCKVQSWKYEGNGVTVQTSKGSYHADRLVLTAGPWSAALIPDIRSLLTVTRQVLAWFHPTTPELFDQNAFPCWLIAEPGRPGAYYGFPIINNHNGPMHGIKIAYHHRGDATDPESVNREVTEEDTAHLREFIEKYMPQKTGEMNFAKTCLYSYSPDEHFIIDHLPGSEGRISMAWGFSGHGFKFSSAVGAILSDLATDGKTDAPIDFLRASRFMK